MQLVVQRVRRAAVRVDDQVVGRIDAGLMVLVGVGRRSTEADAAWLARKTIDLRVFPDEQGRMNRSVAEIGGGVLAVSQFTLYGELSTGRRPSFVNAAPPEFAAALYERYCSELATAGVRPERGIFGAHMVIDMVADGPVTLRVVHETGQGGLSGGSKTKNS